MHALLIMLACGNLAAAWCWHAEAKAKRAWRAAYWGLVRESLRKPPAPSDPRGGTP